MKINRPELLKLYSEEIEKIARLCEDKSIFGPDEIMHIVADILEKNPNLISNE